MFQKMINGYIFYFLGQLFSGQLFELFARETNLKKQSSVRRFAPEVSQYCPSIPQHDDSIDRYILPRTTVFHQYLPTGFARAEGIAPGKARAIPRNIQQYYPIPPRLRHGIVSILSSCLGIEGQYGPPPSLRSGGQPVLRLNSSA